MNQTRPILFSGDLVCAILGGRKTQTRRVIKDPPPEMYKYPVEQWPGLWQWGTSDGDDDMAMWWPGYDKDFSVACPYGVPGDALWVREGFRLGAHFDRGATSSGISTGPGGSGIPKGDWLKHHPAIVQYRADEEYNRVPSAWKGGKWHPSIHMPRWASRLTLPVTGVRIEQLQEITEEDARAEGVKGLLRDPRQQLHGYVPDDYLDYITPFRSLWDRINSKRGFGWDVNPWVWVVEFEPPAPEAEEGAG